MDRSADLSCAELVELVTEYLDDALTPEERRRFDEHLGGCRGCRAYVDQMRKTIDATGRLREEELDPRGRAELLAAFRGWNSPG
jgi:anti-sigma factor RsiW